MSSNDFRAVLEAMVDIFDKCYRLLMSFTIGGIPFFVILMGFLLLSIFVKVISHISLGGGEE